MSRVVIQVQSDQVAFDGRDWTPVRGETAASLAAIARSAEPLYRRQASSHPDHTYNVAVVAAEDLRGKIVEYQPNPRDPNAPSDRIY